MKDVMELLEGLDRLATETTDGHLTLMRFTTGWKVSLGTPDLSRWGRDEVRRMKGHPTLHASLSALLEPDEQEVDDESDLCGLERLLTEEKRDDAR